MSGFLEDDLLWCDWSWDDRDGRNTEDLEHIEALLASIEDRSDLSDR